MTMTTTSDMTTTTTSDMTMTTTSDMTMTTSSDVDSLAPNWFERFLEAKSNAGMTSFLIACQNCRDWRIASLAYEPVLTRTVSHRLYKPGSSANNAEFTSIYSVVTNLR